MSSALAAHRTFRNSLCHETHCDRWHIHCGMGSCGVSECENTHDF